MTSRREMLRALGGIAALEFVGAFGVEELIAVGRRAHALADLRRSGAPGTSPRALTPAQHEMVVQAAERIIPRTDTPGATDAAVADFIDIMLADWYSPGERERFTTGLSELDARARSLAGGGRSFAQSTERQQIAVLETLDGELQVRRQSGAAGANDHWFATLKHLTVWGYYTSRPGIVEELRVELIPGRYDGNAKY
ncbi:MAG TPA: gluconate 2-dehydrogenase subunit 3 family protein [Gemmatimonadaceae bacterium]|nr:gluconate 2-dehydrogenase subunit 3 family protein [Gemmatimonadaceae bacterium]